MQDKISGLDLGPTLAWYEAKQDALLALVLRKGQADTELPCELHGDRAHTLLSPPNIARLLTAFPEAARRRSNLVAIRCEEAHWFHRDSKAGKPIATSDRSQALSPTAVIPSRVINSPADNEIGFETTIVLFRLPDDVGSPPVRWLVHAQGLIHEYAHTILTPEIHRTRALRFRSGNVIGVSGDHLVDAVPVIVNCRPPVSHYASAYYRPDGTLPIIGRGSSEEEVQTALTAVNEVMAEAITALLLGFAFRTDGSGLDPFKDRAPLRAFVEEYLHAERVAAEA